MTSFTTTAYWRPFKNHMYHLLQKTEHSLFWSNIFFNVFTATYKNIKKFASEIFKHTRSGESDVEEAPRI